MLLITFFLIIGFVWSQVVAEINEEKIYRKDFEKVFRAYWERVFHLSLTKPTNEDKRKFLIDYVRSLIILKEAQKMGINVSEKELKSFMKKKVGKIITDKELKRIIKAEIATEKLLDKLVKIDSLKIPERTLRAYYEFYKRDFYYPKRVELLRVYAWDYKTAKKVRKLLEKGGSLEGLDVKVGKPLWFSISALPKRVKRSLYPYKVGKVSRPIKVGEGYLILKILNKKEEGLIPFEEAKNLIIKKIKEEKRKEAFKRWFKRVLKNYRVKFYWENL